MRDMINIYAFADEVSPWIDEQIVAMRKNKIVGLEIRNVDVEILDCKVKEVKSRS